MSFRNILLILFIFGWYSQEGYAQDECTFDEFTDDNSTLNDEFPSLDFKRYYLQTLISFEITEETVNQTELISEMVTSIYNKVDYPVIQMLLDYGVDTCEKEIKNTRKSWSYQFSFNNYENRLHCYPMTYPIPYHLRISCPTKLVEAVRERNITYVNETLHKYKELATCGEGIETLLHQTSNPICTWFECSINPIDLEMAELLFLNGARVHAPDRYGNPTWIDRTCTNKYDSYCDLNGEKPLGNILAKMGHWRFNWYM
jgi:hypothetical protein